MRAILLFLFAVSSVSMNALPKGEVFVATVLSVIDGNVLEVRGADGEVQRVSLLGIDCPESGQPYFEKARKVLEKIILNKEVRVEMNGKNRWGHYLAVVTVVKNGVDPRNQLLDEGLAWTSEKNPDPALEMIRVKAQEKKRGLWSDEEPTAPWIYRREQSMMQAKSS
jgi:micrococcal nuclease